MSASDKCLINPERDCYGLLKAQELEKDLIELRRQNSNSHERIFTRLGEVEKQGSVQEVQYKNLLEKLGNLSSDLNELKADSKEIVAKLPPLTQRVGSLEQLSENVDELKEKPAERWNKAVEMIIGLVVTAVVVYMLSKIGL